MAIVPSKLKHIGVACTFCCMIGCTGTDSSPTDAAPQPPAVVSTVPAQDADSVEVDLVIGVSFTQSIKPGQDFSSLLQFTAEIGRVSVQGAMCSFMPKYELQPMTVYTAAVSGALEFADGTKLGNKYSWSFTTGQADTLPGFPGP